jgi:hypothetical protein
VGLLEEVLEAHGGAERWARVDEVGLRARAGGFALVSKARPSLFAECVARISTRKPRVVLPDWPEPGQRGIFTAERVWIAREDEEVVAERRDPRSAFHGALTVRWDPLHILYFAGYGLWGYLNQPFLFARPGVEARELDSRSLAVTFPREVPAHCREQVFRFDDQLRLVRNDYTAEVFGRWARGKHFSSGHREFGGFLFPTRRRVYLRGTRFPTLVRIDVEDVEIVSAGPAP